MGKIFRGPNRSFSFYLLIFMIFLIVCIVGLLTVNAYVFTRENFDREYQNLEFQTEWNVVEALRLTDTATNILDDSLNDKMRVGLTRVNAEYKRVNGDPSHMDLAALKAELGDGYDIYVIDENGVIVETTYPPELGQDFRSVPYFYQYLTKIRNADGFYPDRVVHELLGAGQYRKYAYMPTADHRYVLELGLGGESFDAINDALDDHKNVKKIISSNLYVEGYTSFNTLGLRVNNNTAPPEPIKSQLAEVIRTRSNLKIVDTANSRITHFLFIDLHDTKYGSDPSRIVMITYNTSLIEDALNHLLIYHIVVALIAIITGCILAFFLSRHMTRPIHAIVEDVGIIARGNLNHRIRETRNVEFAILETGINTMVDSLKTAFQKMKDDEIFQNEMIDQLPVAIFITRASDGKYIFWNKMSEHLFGIPASETLGKTDADLFSPDVVNDIRAENSGIFTRPGEVRNKIISRREHGGTINHMIIVPVFDSHGTPQYIMGISEDVSQQNINLKMDLLFSITRHDILDNLSVIMNHLERAQLKNTHEEMQQFFDKTVGSIEAIRNQIAYMRALQELGFISPKWQRVERAFRDAVLLLPKHRASIISEVGDVEIFADPLLPRVFYNLLENSLRNNTRAKPEISLFTRRETDDLLIVYTDTGYSIPRDQKEKIFDGSDDTGTMRGLFLIRELLGFTGITIQEDGTPEAGIRFEIRVPKGKYRFL
ncbi:PAS domain-containing protein [Methanoregula formicica]|uniref:histidine kinase n=1 Tax=Methanoregula formicica (strain DSM 22288 / NBRC 105244 / SMSP) TaxID=593750 RepID=L0HE03_METFS|nr:PAS domain-containing protein [Methanoregula formicica]AGB02225.1 PAS domain S-box [Methanoregula formicica SMSP]